MRMLTAWLLAAALLLTACEQKPASSASGSDSGSEAGTGAASPASSSAAGEEEAAPPLASRLSELGKQLLAAGNTEDAIPVIEAAMSADPLAAGPYADMGGYYITMGETDENLATAQEYYRIAAQLDSRLSDAWLGIADTQIRQKDYAGALSTLWNSPKVTSNTDAVNSKITELRSGTITDSSGNIRRITKSNARGTILWFHDYDYDAQGRRSSVTSFSPDGIQTGYLELKYRDDGQPLNSFSYDENTGTLSQTVYNYGANGMVSEKITYASDGTDTGHTLYTYEGDLVVREDTCDSEGNLVGYFDQEFDEQNRLIKRTYHEPKGTKIYSTEYTYNEMNLCSEALTYFNTYSWLGMVLNQRRVFNYDPSGVLLSIDTYDGDDNLLSSEPAS